MSKTSGLMKFFLLNFTKSKNSLNSSYTFILGKAAINKDRMSLKITSALWLAHVARCCLEIFRNHFIVRLGFSLITVRNSHILNCSVSQMFGSSSEKLFWFFQQFSVASAMCGWAKEANETGRGLKNILLVYLFSQNIVMFYYIQEQWSNRE